MGNLVVADDEAKVVDRLRARPAGQDVSGVRDADVRNTISRPVAGRVFGPAHHFGDAAPNEEIVFMWEQDLGVFPVDFERQGDEWAHHVAVELTGHGHMAARGTDGTSPVELGPPMSGSLASRLRAQQDDNGIVCTVVGDSEATSDDQVQPVAPSHHRSGRGVGPSE
jgi:hypothetical protein